MAKIIELILTHERRGKGTKDDPVRLCPQLWTKAGELIGEVDSMPLGNHGKPAIIFWPAALGGSEEET